MAIYQTKDHVTCGMPFGGIGAGKMEVTPQGLFNAFTFQNNWSEPLQGNSDYPGILGFHLGFFAEALELRANTPRKKAYLLQTIPVLGLPTVKNILYEGTFPRAVLRYEMPGIDLDLSLEVFSPWIPGDIKHSSLPAVFFDLKVKNNTERPVNAGFLFIGRNVCGEWCVGRQNRVFFERRSIGVEFSNHDPSSRDVRHGALRFSFLKEEWNASFMESWNAVTKNFSFTAQNISLAAWGHFEKDGRLPNTHPAFVAHGENQELCAAVMMSRALLPGAQKHLPFNAAWHFPHHPLGHDYKKTFKAAAVISRYITPRQGELQKKY